MNPYLKILRPKSWLKNLLVFIPLLLFGSVTDNLVACFVAFIMLCCVSSLAYIANDISNIDEDRINSKDRPLATGKVSLDAVLIISEVLFWTFIIIGFFNNNAVLVISATMLGIDFLYIWKLRDIAIVDVATIAIKYPLRLLAGFVIVGIFNPLLMLLVYLIALNLAIMKRKGEWMSGMKRKVFKVYNSTSLDDMFTYTYVLLNIVTFITLFIVTNSFIISLLSIPEMYFIGKYYFNIKGYDKAKSLAILKDKKIVLIGIIIFALMVIKLHGVNWIV